MPKLSAVAAAGGKKASVSAIKGKLSCLQRRKGCQSNDDTGKLSSLVPGRARYSLACLGLDSSGFTSSVSSLVSWCFEPSQPQSIISALGLKEEKSDFVFDPFWELLPRVAPM